MQISRLGILIANKKDSPTVLCSAFKMAFAGQPGASLILVNYRTTVADADKRGSQFSSFM